MLYLRDGNNLTSEQEAAIETALRELGLKVSEVREAIVVSLPDPGSDPKPASDPIIASAIAEASNDPGIISFDDALDRLRRPWWRRWLDRVCRLFRR